MNININILYDCLAGFEHIYKIDGNRARFRKHYGGGGYVFHGQRVTIL